MVKLQISVVLILLLLLPSVASAGAGLVDGAGAPESITIDRFEFVDGAFQWDALLDAVRYQVTYGYNKPFTGWVVGQAPGAQGFFSYRVTVQIADFTSIPQGLYCLWAQDAYSGDIGVVATLVAGR